MNLKHIDAVNAQPSQALFRRTDDMVGNGSEILGPDLDLGIEDRPGSEALQRETQIGLSYTGAVVRRIVEISDAKFERPRNNSQLLFATPSQHEARIATATKSNFRDDQISTSDGPVAHFSRTFCSAKMLNSRNPGV